MNMNKSLIAMTVAGLFAAPAAMAEVTISGAINVGIQYGKSSSSTAGGSSLTTQQLGPAYSNFNLASTDDIGNGNKIIFNYQFDISGTSTANPTRAGGAIGNRNSYLGVQGGWGTFKMGTNENVYERHMYQADPLDGAVGVGGNLNILGTPGAGTVFEVGQAGCATGCVGFYRRAEQQIWYESPNFGGFTFEVDYTLAAFKTAGPGATNPQILSAGVKWQPEGRPFYIDFAIEQHEDMFGVRKITGALGNGTGSSDDAMQIGAGWQLGNLGLNARFERLSYELDGGTGITKYERDAMWFGVKWGLASGYVGAQIGIADEGDTNLGTATDTGATMIGVGYFHNLSKQSQLQIIYGRTDNDAAATYLQIGAAGGAGTGLAGSDHQAFTVAIKHTF